MFKVGVWRPEDTEKAVPRGDVLAKVAETFDTFNVVAMLCDPPLWRNEIAGWVDEYNTDDNERVLSLDTLSARRFSPLCERFATAIDEAAVRHDGDPTLTEHLAACVKKQVRLKDDPDDMRSRWVVEKAKPRKNDAAVAAILAYGAAMDAPKPKAEPKAARVLRMSYTNTSRRRLCSC